MHCGIEKKAKKKKKMGIEVQKIWFSFSFLWFFCTILSGTPCILQKTINVGTKSINEEIIY